MSRKYNARFLAVALLTLIFTTVTQAFASLNIAYVPLVSKGDLETTIIIENQSTTEALLVLNYYEQDGTLVCSAAGSVAGSDSAEFQPTCAGDGFLGSAIVNSDQPITSQVKHAQFGQETTHDAFNEGLLQLFVSPVKKEVVNNSTLIAVQNTSDSQATIELSFETSSCTQTRVVQPGAATIFDQKVDNCLETGFSSRALLSSDQPIAATGFDINYSTGELQANNGTFSPSAVELDGVFVPTWTLLPLFGLLVLLGLAITAIVVVREKMK